MLPMPSDRVREILPPDTAATWDAIAPPVPSDAYLGGGTAIAVRLGHRISRDLDFFFHHGSVDPDDALPVPRAQIVDYWTRRQREIVAARGRLPM